MFSWFEGHFAANLLRVLIDRAHAAPELPDLTDAQREAFVSGIPMGCLGTAADIAGAVAFLASDDALNITGQEIKVDGGITLRTGN